MERIEAYYINDIRFVLNLPLRSLKTTSLRTALWQYFVRTENYFCFVIFLLQLLLLTKLVPSLLWLCEGVPYPRREILNARTPVLIILVQVVTDLTVIVCFTVETTGYDTARYNLGCAGGGDDGHEDGGDDDASQEVHYLSLL